jgi:hypothetical protein
MMEDDDLLIHTIISADFIVSMPRTLPLSKIARITISIAFLLASTRPSHSLLSSSATIGIHHFASDYFRRMVVTRQRRNNASATSRPLHVLSSVSSSSQEKPAPVTPSPAKKRRRVSSSPSTKQRGAAPAKKELNFVSALTSEAVAAINPDQPYIDLKVPPAELRPSATLTTGQCFHWKAITVQQRTDDATKIESPKKESAWGSHDASKW